jgi:ethanolamine utilization protein EutA
MEIDTIKLLSVGIDVGSSTTHMIFSNLMLSKDELSPSRRFQITNRTILYEGRIIHTPILDDDIIDFDRLSLFAKEECRRAGIDPADIQSGAVIVTGETAKKHNARQIAESISKDAGKFVAATAGPNFESLLAAMGSGAVARSKNQDKTILSCDIGGGTANLAISVNGRVTSTSCISIGGRLLAMDSTGSISRLDQPAIRVMDYLGLTNRIGDRIHQRDIDQIASTLAETLVEVMTGPADSVLARQLMVTDNLNFPNRIDEISFSGGVAEFIYGEKGHFGDIGNSLAENIVRLIPKLNAPVVEPTNKIRATVIGAGAYSLSISGCSGFMDDRLAFPIRNIPVLRVDAEYASLSVDHVVSRIKQAFQRYDLTEGKDMAALYFRDPVRVNYPDLELFARSIEIALENSINNNLPVILIFEKDIACSVGNVIKRETRLKNNLLSLDELILKDGDWIDIGEPLIGRQVFPVTVKSLVFHGS